MLIVTIHNDSSGTLEIGNYDYKIYINKELLEEGRVEKHRRADGYDVLIDKVAKTSKKKKIKSLMKLCNSFKENKPKEDEWV